MIYYNIELNYIYLITGFKDGSLFVETNFGDFNINTAEINHDNVIYIGEL